MSYLVQVIFGKGFPSAAQLRVAGSPLETVRDFGCSSTHGGLPPVPGEREEKEY